MPPPPIGYFLSASAAEPRANDIVTFSPGLSGWNGTYNGRMMSYSMGTFAVQHLFAYTGLFGVGYHYAKGVSYTDLVHRHEYIPAGQTWYLNVWGRRDSDLANTDEWLKYGIYVWRGATDSQRTDIGTIATGGWQVTSSWAEYTATPTNANPIVLYPGDRIAVEFWAEIRILSGSHTLTKWSIGVYVGDSTYDSYLQYPHIMPVRRDLGSQLAA